MNIASVITAGNLLGLDARGWSAVGTNVLGIGAVMGGLWAVYNYRQSRRAEAARWLRGLFQDFYTQPELIAGRELLEYDFADRLGPLLLIRVTDRYIPLSERQREDLRRIDLVLNYFEHLLYLESDRHILKRDREVFFEYWFGVMNESDRAGLRRYLAKCGYERCTHELCEQYGGPEHLALYGSLMKESPDQDQLGVRDQLEYIGPCVLRGQLYSLGDWPGLVDDDCGGDVVGELYLVKDVGVFQILDPFEHFDPCDPTGGKYLRRAVRLRNPNIDAWTYIYNWPIQGEPHVEHGSWPRYVQERN